MIGLQTPDNFIGVAGVGRVVIPDVPRRLEYIEECHRTKTLTIHGGYGYGYFSAVPCPPDVMQNIRFPSGSEDDNRGTAVIWVRDAITQRPVIVSWLMDNGDYYETREFLYRKTVREGDVTLDVSMDGETGRLSVNVTGDDARPATVDIQLQSTSGESKFKVSTDSELSLIATKKVNVSTEGELDIQLTDGGEIKARIHYDHQMGLAVESDVEVHIESPKIRHNKGNEPMVLGETLRGILDDLISQINQLTVPTALGPSGVPINVPAFTAIQQRLKSILSDKSTIE